jgi:hypothetical protein
VIVSHKVVEGHSPKDDLRPVRALHPWSTDTLGGRRGSILRSLLGNFEENELLGVRLTGINGVSV